MSSDRQRLRPWLEGRINSGQVPGLRWLDPDKTKFRITWKHAGKPDFNIDEDAVLFREWAEHTGKYKRGEQPDPSTWKTRFRCALHKMPDIEEIRIPHSLDENEPYRVFRFKPKVTISPKQRKHTVAHHFPVPSPPPLPLNDFNMFSYPPSTGYHGIIKNSFPMGFNPDFPFPSPQSSPTSSADLNNNTFEDIDHINPTIPPFAFPFDQPMEHLKQVPPLTALNDDFFFKTNCGQYSTTDYEPTLTELQSVSRGEQFSYPGGSTGALASDSMVYNNVAYNVAGNTCMYSGQNGTSPSQQMGLLSMLHAHVGSPVEMVQEMSIASPVTTSFGSNIMDTPPYSMASSEKTTFSSHPMTPARKTALNVIASQIESININEAGNDVWFCRVYYMNKEVNTFEVSSKHSWRICYEKPVKPVDDTSLSQSCQVVHLPESADDKVRTLLETFSGGVILEVLRNGVTWVTKICQSKVALSRGSKNITRLSRDIRTKVFEDRKPNDMEYMLSIGEHPPLVKIVFIPLKERKIENKLSYTD